MTQIPNGGPAFPMRTTVEVTDCEGDKHPATALYNGMSLRDYFAGQALASMLAPPSQISDGTPDIAARLSYRFADAMLAAREVT